MGKLVLYFNKTLDVGARYRLIGQVLEYNKNDGMLILKSIVDNSEVGIFMDSYIMSSTKPADPEAFDKGIIVDMEAFCASKTDSEQLFCLDISIVKEPKLILDNIQKLIEFTNI